MHKMQTTVTDVPGACPSICLSRSSTRLHCVKTAERINILFGVNTLGGLRNIVLDRGTDPPTARERVIRCTLCQITLASCLYLQLVRCRLTEH